MPGESFRCERAREWCSYRLDGELSEVEQALLDRHLEECGSCSEHDRVLALTASLLRSAPVERPERQFLLPVAERRAKVSRFPAQRRLTVALVAAALTLGSVIGSQLQRPAAPAPVRPSPQLSFLSRDVQQLRDLPRTRAQTPTRLLRVNPPEGIA